MVIDAVLLVLVAWQVRRLELLAWAGAVTVVGRVATPMCLSSHPVPPLTEEQF
jgi:hypothetical protein